MMKCILKEEDEGRFNGGCSKGSTRLFIERLRTSDHGLLVIDSNS